MCRCVNVKQAAQIVHCQQPTKKKKWRYWIVSSEAPRGIWIEIGGHLKLSSSHFSSNFLAYLYPLIKLVTACINIDIQLICIQLHDSLCGRLCCCSDQMLLLVLLASGKFIMSMKICSKTGRNDIYNFTCTDYRSLTTIIEALTPSNNENKHYFTTTTIIKFIVRCLVFFHPSSGAVLTFYFILSAVAQLQLCFMIPEETGSG